MSLPYFPMYPTDFEAKTSHLTMAEDGAYNRLLRICWMTPGCDMPADEAWVMRRARAVTDADQDAVRSVLGEFFTIENGRFSNARLKRVFAASVEAHEKRVSAGSKGGKAKSLKINNTRPSNAKAKPKQPEPEPEPYKKEDTNVSLSLAMPDDVQTAFDDFNAMATDAGMPIAKILSKKRRTAIAARMKEAGGISGWRIALAKARASPLCTGDNDRGWVADLDFLVTQSKFTKLMEGSYDARTPSNNPANGNAGIGSGTARAAAAVAERRIAGHGRGSSAGW